MKKVIEMLKQLADDLSFDRPYSKEALGIVCEDTRLGILDVIELLQAPPRWETPEQYKERTGEDWPDERNVFFRYASGHDTYEGIYYDSFCGAWHIAKYSRIKGFREAVQESGSGRYQIVCVPEAGPPPEDW
jgi:hypothetical protein